MPKTKYTIKQNRSIPHSPAGVSHTRRATDIGVPHTRRTTDISFRLNRMTSDELIDVFSAITAIEKGIRYVPTSSNNVTIITQRYRYSPPSTRKRMLQNISKIIVQKNTSENPATPEMMAKLKKNF